MQFENVTIGEWIAILRKRAGLTQGELGERIGESKWTIHRIETGSREPSDREVAAILDAVDATDYSEICSKCAVGEKMQIGHGEAAEN